ncbi:hypothetical protein CVT24_007016 [Panaeolus cyanescens]|uniref:Uncharacterized protein n=1 Tax=Panaeolus cyanescens TaxID=181874 RepID=A0A409YKF9_9AGAR|nr:hypothetical protein CVT24_007016 [Panaeolus cyanescens]
MSSESMIDLIPLERKLYSAEVSLRNADSDDLWIDVATTAREIANNLRVRNSITDNHTILGKTELPQTLTSLLSLALDKQHVPDDKRTDVVLELLRVGANLCMDHNDNRTSLLEVTFPQAVVSLLEGYADKIPLPFVGVPFALSIQHLKVVRTAVGVLLNASIGHEMVKYRLISLEAALTLIKLSASVCPPSAWVSSYGSSQKDVYEEEWEIRSAISSWSWRTISALKDVTDETLQILNSDVLPWITFPLLKYCPPNLADSSPLLDADPDLLYTLLSTDFEFFQQSCTIIESLSLDNDDIRFELPRSLCHVSQEEKLPCLSIILDFIEYGTYPPIWDSSVLDDQERSANKKGLDMCKAALIKAVVEVFGEEKNEDVLWKPTDGSPPGGPIISRLVDWIKKDTGDSELYRDDMTICASLSLGNLTKKVHFADAFLSAPYSLAGTLSSDRFLSSSTDIKVKHGILGFLKHIAQFSRLSPKVPASFLETHLIHRLIGSSIWDERSDVMADIIQLNAIGIAKHLCNGSLDHTFEFILSSESSDDKPTGLTQILALIKRSDSVSIKSEGSRVLVNVVKTLWYTERAPTTMSEERQKKRDECVARILTPEYTTALTSLIARSNRYPILVNEGIVAITLLSTHRLGAPLVLQALIVPLNSSLPVEDNLTSPALPTSSSRGDGLPVPRNALDMLIYVLKNVDNPVNFAVEVRTNACIFFTHLLRQPVAHGALAKVRSAVLPVVEQVAEEAQGVKEEEKLYKAAKALIEAWTAIPVPTA